MTFVSRDRDCARISGQSLVLRGANSYIDYNEVYVMLEYLIGLVVVLYVLCKKSERIEYYVKMAMFAVGSVVVSSLLPLPLFVYRMGDYRNALPPSWALRTIFPVLGVTHEVRGVENIHKGNGGVVLINHQSIIDLVVLAYLWPIIGRASVVAKRLILFIYPPAYGWGTLFIDRANRTDAVNKLNKEAAAISDRSLKLMIFPEGTRGGESDKLLPFKKGPFHIAVSSQSIVQPVVVSRYTFLDGYSHKRFGSGHVIISVLPEIDCKKLDKSHIPELLELTQTLMQAEYDALNEEIRLLSLRKSKISSSK